MQPQTLQQPGLQAEHLLRADQDTFRGGAWCHCWIWGVMLRRVPHFSVLGNHLLAAETRKGLLDGRQQTMQDRHDMQDNMLDHSPPL